MSKEKWYCYICGKPIEKIFFLTSLNDRTDRVFLKCSESCKDLVEIPFFFRKVMELQDFVQKQGKT